MYGHVLLQHRDVRSVHAGYLKIVKAAGDGFALAEGLSKGREGGIVRSERMALSPE